LVALTIISIIIDVILILNIITKNNYNKWNILILVVLGFIFPKPIIAFVFYLTLKYILKYKVGIMQILLLFVLIGSLDLIIFSLNAPITLSVVLIGFIKAVFIFTIKEDKEYIWKMELTLLTHKYIIALLYFLIYVILQFI